MLLANCAPATSDNSCGILIKYSVSLQNNAALELEEMAKNVAYPTVQSMMVDYHRTRQSIKVCRGESLR